MSDRTPRSPAARTGPRGGAVAPGSSTEAAPAPTASRIRAALWTTIPSALATEIGALAMMAAGALVGVAAGVVGVIALYLALRRLVPGQAVVRAALLVGGPPLRYALLIVAVWFEWTIRGSGPGPALAGGVLLAVVVPMLGGVLASPRGLRSRN